MCPEVVNSQSLLLICLVMLRPIHTRNCGMSTLFAPISKWKGSTHLKIRANLFPVRTYWGHCHYSGSKHNTFEVWRWSGGWRGPSRWAKGLLRAVEWERTEDASQQGQPDENVWVGGCQQPTNTRVGLHRSGGGGLTCAVTVGTSSNKLGSKAEIHPNHSSLIFAICPFVIIGFFFSEWGEKEFTQTCKHKCPCVLLSDFVSFNTGSTGKKRKLIISFLATTEVRVCFDC